MADDQAPPARPEHPDHPEDPPAGRTPGTALRAPDGRTVRAVTPRDRVRLITAGYAVPDDADAPADPPGPPAGVPGKGRRAQLVPVTPASPNA